MNTPTATKSLLAVLFTVAALVPTLAEAQAGATLGNPEITVVVRIPAPTQRYVLDPEIAAMRAGRPLRQAPYRAVGLPVGQFRVEAAQEGPTFGRSFGHSWAGFGIGVGAGALVGGVITAAAVCPNDTSGFCFLLSLSGAGLGALATAPFGAALGTWGFGERNGGTGNFFAALGGAYLGAGLGIGVGALLGSLGSEGAVAGSVLAPIVGILLTNIGAAAGYQLSSHGARDDARAQGPMIVPTLSPVEGGATVGAAGMF